MSGDLIGAVLRGVLGGRRKRSRNALRFLTGGSRRNPLLTRSTLMTAAGVAWGIYETLQARTSDSPTVATTPVPPPLPDAAPMTDEALRMLRLVISAAAADGAIADAERLRIVEQAGDAGAAEVLEHEVAHPRTLAAIVAGVTDAAERATLYVLAFTVLRADELVSGVERIYLARLASLLDIEPQLAQKLEQDAAARIDALGDEASAATPPP